MAATRNHMVAMADLYSRKDAIDIEIGRVDDELKRLVAERQRLVAEDAHITAGITAIGQSAGMYTEDKT